MKTPEEIATQIASEHDWFEPGDVIGMMTDAIKADQAQRADEVELPEPWRTTLRVIEGDGEEYTDTVLVRFTRAWDVTLTREHTVSWETFVKALVVVARIEAEGDA